MVGLNLQGVPAELSDLEPGEWGLVSIGIEPGDSAPKLALCISKNQDEGSVRLLLIGPDYSLVHRYEVPDYPVFRLMGELRFDLPPREFHELESEPPDLGRLAVAFCHDGSLALIASQQHGPTGSHLRPIAFNFGSHKVEEVPRRGFYWTSGLLKYRATETEQWTPLMVLNGHRGGWQPFGE